LCVLLFFVLLVIVLCVLLFFVLLVIVLCVLRFTDSDCPFGIFKVFTKNNIN
jgi:hypothetical protein